MGKRIEYNNGDIVGSCIYIFELPIRKFNSGQVQRMAMFMCPLCGNKFSSQVADVRSGHTNSCGCYGKQRRLDSLTSHGLTHHPLYQTWLNIKKRCYNDSDPGYHNYGGRGISMYEPWMKTPDAFIDYVSKLSNYGEPGMTLDRENNDGNYEPGNLRWVDMRTQLLNRRNTVSA